MICNQGLTGVRYCKKMLQAVRFLRFEPTSIQRGSGVKRKFSLPNAMECRLSSSTELATPRNAPAPFLMDHVPRAPIRTEGTAWKRRDVYRALNLLVDECLKRELWKQQLLLAKDRPDLAIFWWAPHAPEPLTLIHWLQEAKAQGHLPTGDSKLRILHPDPPLGPDERSVLEEILAFGGMPGKLDVMTPRQLASRGG